MTATSLEDVSAALGTALGSIDDLNVYPTIGAPYSLPAAIVDLPEIPEYMESMGRGGTTMAPFHVFVYVARAVDDIACSELLAYVDGAGDRSIRQALMDDINLKSVVDAVYIRSYFRSTGDLDGTPTFIGDFLVEVHYQRER
jgi:hypothetical protein